jgi:hypothetical protein
VFWYAGVLLAKQNRLKLITFVLICVVHDGTSLDAFILSFQ